MKPDEPIDIGEQERPIRVRRALISAWRKPPAVDLGRVLQKLGVSILASGGTAEALSAAGVGVERLSSLTGFDDLLGGRVKTLHPGIHAAILARDTRDDLDRLGRLGIEPIDLVAVDLYPFSGEVSKSGGAQALELIDIGGVALARAAAKNYPRVAALCDADLFVSFAGELAEAQGFTTLYQRRALAARTFSFTAKYDGLIANFLADLGDGSFPPGLVVSLKRQGDLRYGENPHQPGAFYAPDGSRPFGLGAVRQLGGKQLSYNNLLDLDVALALPYEFDQPAAAILKHTTPCGVGLGEDITEAFLNARSSDETSAFGSIVGLNRTVDLTTAKAVREGFVEVVAAPGYEPEALQVLQKSKNLRIIERPGEEDDVQSGGLLSGLRDFDLRSVRGGILVQRSDRGFPEWAGIRIPTRLKPDEGTLQALRFSWVVARWVKSNAIVIADGKRTIGIGAGQMSRVDAAHLAVWKAKQAGLATVGAVAASDAFFPFRDGLDVLADAGVRAVVQPGGSVRDDEVIAAADERGLAMVFTGRRHFRH